MKNSRSPRRGHQAANNEQQLQLSASQPFFIEENLKKIERRHPRPSLEASRSSHHLFSQKPEDLNPKKHTSFVVSLTNYLDSELQKANSDSDIVFTYKQAFDYATEELTDCRSLLERIKKEYDNMSSYLLSKKREIMIDTTSVSSTEDSFADLLTKQRKLNSVKKKEAKQKAEELLDVLTDQRLKKSELMATKVKLEEIRRELKHSEKNQAEQMNDMNAYIHELQDETKLLEKETSEIEKQNIFLEDKAQKTVVSNVELRESEQKLQIEIDDNAGLLEKAKQEFNDAEKRHKDKIDFISTLMNTESSLRREIAESESKLSTIHSKSNLIAQRLTQYLISIDRQIPDGASLMDLVDLLK